MDLGTARTRVKGYLGNRSDATSPLVDDFIKEEIRELALPFFFDSLETTDASITTVDGTASYAIPSSLYVVERARDTTNDTQLEHHEYEWYLERDPEAKGFPTDFAQYGEQVVLWPTPDGAYSLKLWGIKLPAMPAVDADPLPYPEDWHMILVLNAAASLAFYFGVRERGMELKNEALGKISTRQEKRTLRRRSMIGQITPQRTR